MNSTRTLLVTATAAGLLVGAAATAGLLTAGSASAAGALAGSTPSPSSSAHASPGGPGGPGPHGGPRGARGFGDLRGLGAGGPVLHGEFVTGGPNGATQTVVVQTGTVSAKQGSKITVTSSDGYKVNWVLNDSTKVRTGWSQGAVKDIADGDSVRIRGTKSGDTATARLVAQRPKGAAPAPRTNGSGSSGSASPSGA